MRRLKEARQFVCDAIAPWGGPTGDAALLTSEVVGNAIRHGEGEVALRVRRDATRALVEVHDQSAEPPKQQPFGPRRVGGNGVRIIEALASSWGVTQIHDDGKIVWFAITLPW
jgi:anti-sigma regulatory factor (Ser/Thr protein kinase)